MTLWTRWVRQPQGLWVRKAMFQVHLWTGIALALYVAVICLSGSVLVYRVELYNYFSPDPGADPATLPWGFHATTWLLELHDNLLFGRTGRRVNAVGAALMLALAATGAVIWWPGINSWRRSLTVAFKRRQRFTWRLHSMLGFWFFVFVVMWCVSGLYLAYPAPFSDRVEDWRAGERFLYWLGYSHFGRFTNRVPGCGLTCGTILKAVWAVSGLMPVAMLVTGAMMWWTRVVSSSSRRAAREDLHTTRTHPVRSS